MAARPLTSVRPQIVDALEHADAGILCVQPQQGELGARMDIVADRRAAADPLRAHGRRDAEIMHAGHARRLPAGRRLSQRLCERMRDAQRVCASRRPHGTALTATFDPSLSWVKTSGLINRATGRTCRPARSSPRRRRSTASFVCNGTAGDYFGPKYGDLRATPLTLEIAGGRLRRRALRARQDLEREFWDYCHTDEHSDRVGELAFGTNLALDDMIGVLLQDEKIPGVHLAFGDPYGSQTGAAWKSRTHIDVLTRELRRLDRRGAGDRPAAST